MPQVHFGVSVEGDGAHEFLVAATLHGLVQTSTGRAVLSEIQRARFPVTVIPQVTTPGTGPSNFTRQGFREATQAGATARDGLGRQIGGFGTGVGGAVRVHFTPHVHAQNAPLEGPDAVLLHELAHATRYAHGKVSNAPMYEYGVQTREEVHAMIVTNMYRSERNLMRFRIQRVPNDRWGGLADANQTFGMAKYLIRRFHSLQREFFDDLAVIDTPFNPVRTALGGA